MFKLLLVNSLKQISAKPFMVKSQPNEQTNIIYKKMQTQYVKNNP